MPLVAGAEVETFAALCSRLDDPFADRVALLREMGLDEVSLRESMRRWSERMRADGALAERFRCAYRDRAHALHAAPPPSRAASAQPVSAHGAPRQVAGSEGARPPSVAPASTPSRSEPLAAPSYLLASAHGRPVATEAPGLGLASSPFRAPVGQAPAPAVVVRHDTDEVDPAAYQSVALPFSRGSAPPSAGAAGGSAAATSGADAETDMVAATVAKMLAQHGGVGFGVTAPLAPVTAAREVVPFDPRARPAASVVTPYPARLAPQPSTGTVAPLRPSAEVLPFADAELETYARLSAELALASHPGERAAALAASGLGEREWAELKSKWDPRAERDAAIQARCLEVLRELGKARG